MKTYVKPELYFESFELSQNIAACDLKLNGQSHWLCKIVGHGTDTGGAFGDLERELTGSFINDQACAGNVVGEAEFYCYTNGANFFPKFFQS